MSPIHLLGSINVTVCFDNHIPYPHLIKEVEVAIQNSRYLSELPP